MTVFGAFVALYVISSFCVSIFVIIGLCFTRYWEDHVKDIDSSSSDEESGVVPVMTNKGKSKVDKNEDSF